MRNLLKIYIYNLEIYLFLYILSNYLYLWLLWISNVISWGASSKQEYLLWVVTCANFTALMKKMLIYLKCYCITDEEGSL